ncbi:hypothetical protein [Amycolatopsis granulosa]|uniref:hypothetical protein n=1 Tax=Amycolatopsis granulosa TaxID=185684 RepID=UPI00141DEF31|nr:hypothetical protein [Amycolatopsis granulosa]
MISWGVIGYGALLSAIVAAVLLVATTRRQRLPVAITGALAAAAGPLAWNSILRATRGVSFFTDAPITVFPVSWQDTGSAVFTLAVGFLALSLGPLRTSPAVRVVTPAALAALAALLVDVYLY